MIHFSVWRNFLSIEKVVAHGFVTFFATILGYLILFIIARKIYNLECDLSLTLLKLFRPRSDSKLRSKVVWITGASSGIGQALAVHLARCGCKLILSGRDLGKLGQTKEFCLTTSDLSDADILIKVFDLKDTEKHHQIYKDIIRYFRKLDIFVNNAGTSQRASFSDIDIRVDRDIFETNVFGGLHLTRIITDYWLHRKLSGHIVVTSSIVGKAALPYCASYTASKHALHGYYECLRAEHFKNNIQVTMVCSGPVKTNITRSSYTETLGKKLGQTLPSDCNRMSPQRHAELMSLAISNGLEEVWITSNPFLLFCYLNQYLPTISKRYFRCFSSYLSSARDS